MLVRIKHLIIGLTCLSLAPFAGASINAICNKKRPHYDSSTGLTSEHRQLLVENLPYPAVLEPLDHTLLSTELNVRVITIYKRMGDCFEKGEPLVQLDDINLKANYDRAVAIRQKAACVLATKERLHQSGIASNMDLIDAKAQFAVADADVRIAHKNLSDSTIRAPYNGRVVLINVEEDEYPLQEWHIKNKPIMEVINDTVLRAKVLIPSSLLRHVEIGDKLLIQIKETNETTTGTITRIGVMMDPVSATIPIEAEINNSDGKLLGGMTGSATLKMEAL